MNLIFSNYMGNKPSSPNDNDDYHEYTPPKSTSSSIPSNNFFSKDEQTLIESQNLLRTPIEEKTVEEQQSRTKLFKNPIINEIKTEFKNTPDKFVSLVVSHNLRIQCLLDKIFPSTPEKINLKNCSIIRILIDNENCLLELVYEGTISEKEKNQNLKYYNINGTDNNNIFFQVKIISTPEILNNLNLKKEDINSKKFVFYIIRNCQTHLGKEIGQKMASLLFNNKDKINYIFSSDLKKTRQTIVSLYSSIISKLQQIITSQNPIFNPRAWKNISSTISPLNYIDIQKLIILPCSHEISTKGNGTGNCDEASSSSLPNRPDCLKINIENEEKNNCNNLDISENNKSIPIDWDFYFNFYGNKMRGENTISSAFSRQNKNKNSCRNTNIISLIISYIKDSHFFGHIIQTSFNQETVALIDVDNTLTYGSEITHDTLNTYLLDFLQSKNINYIYLFTDMRFTTHSINERYNLIKILKEYNITVLGVITPPDIFWSQLYLITDELAINLWNDFLKTSKGTQFISFFLKFIEKIIEENEGNEGNEENINNLKKLRENLNNYNPSLSIPGKSFSDALSELKNTQNISEGTSAKGNISKIVGDDISMHHAHVKGLMLDVFLEHKPTWIKSILVIDDNLDVQKTIREFKSDIPITIIPIPSKLKQIHEVAYDTHYLEHTQKITQQPKLSVTQSITSSVLSSVPKKKSFFGLFGGKKSTKNATSRKNKKTIKMKSRKK